MTSFKHVEYFFLYMRVEEKGDGLVLKKCALYGPQGRVVWGHFLVNEYVYWTVAICFVDECDSPLRFFSVGCEKKGTHRKKVRYTVLNNASI